MLRNQRRKVGMDNLTLNEPHCKPHILSLNVQFFSTSKLASKYPSFNGFVPRQPFKSQITNHEMTLHEACLPLEFTRILDGTDGS